MICIDSLQILEVNIIVEFSLLKLNVNMNANILNTEYNCPAS